MKEHFSCSVCEKYFDLDKHECTRESLEIDKSDNHNYRVISKTKSTTASEGSITYQCLDCGHTETKRILKMSSISLDSTGTTINWSAIPNAEKYIVYKDGKAIDNGKFTSYGIEPGTTSGTYCVSAYTSSKEYEGVAKSNTITISGVRDMTYADAENISITSTNNDTIKFHLLCLEINSSHNTFANTSAMYKLIITTGLISKSSTEDGKKIATNIVSTITEKNQIFSYGVKAFQSLIILSFIFKNLRYLLYTFYVIFANFFYTNNKKSAIILYEVFYMIKDEIRKDILDLASKAEDDLKEIFANVDKTCMINSNRVLSAFIENNVSYSDFAERNGYGNYDAGRDKLEAIFAYTLGMEDALVRPQIMSGTNALYLAFSGLLKHGDTLLSISGKPYDSLLEMIGIIGNSSQSLIA